MTAVRIFCAITIELAAAHLDILAADNDEPMAFVIKKLAIFDNIIARITCPIVRLLNRQPASATNCRPVRANKKTASDRVSDCIGRAR